MAVRRGIDKAVEAAIEHCSMAPKPVSSKEEIAESAISANNDREDRRPAGRRHGESRQTMA